MTTVELSGPPTPRAILVIADKIPFDRAEAIRKDLQDAFARGDWPIVLACEKPIYWLPVGEIGDAEELLQAAYVFINNFVDASQAEIDGFNVEAWCAAVEALGITS